MKTAIIAHFDADSIWDENFLAILRIVCEVIDQTVIVTTAKDIGQLPQEFDNVTVVRRCNIGYDYYSYRVGVYLTSLSGNCCGILFINSSFFLFNSDLFRSLLENIIRNGSQSAVRGLTESRQFGWHLQSYLLYFDFNIIKNPDEWFLPFFQSIEPVNTKLEYIFNYELGLGKILKVEKISSESLFNPGIVAFISGIIMYHSSLIKKYGIRDWLSQISVNKFQNINWTHFCALSIARQFGIVKAELLRDNPHQMPLRKIWDTCSMVHLSTITESINRTGRHYIKNPDGTTVYNRSADQGNLIKEIVVSSGHQKAHSEVAVVVHLFYLDLLEEIFGYLRNIIEPYDLYITTPFESDVSKIIEISSSRNQDVTVVLTHNKGRDVGPFVALYKTGKLDNYKSILKIHSKKSLYTQVGGQWREQLLKSLCGSSLTVLRSQKLLLKEGCGIVGPTGFFLVNPVYWGANQNNVKSILSACGIDTDFDAPTLSFFAGTMFWFTPKSLNAIHKCRGSVLAFEDEDGKLDGTLAHAWERSFCLIAKAAGYSISTNELNGKDVIENISESNCVHPVINSLDRANNSPDV